MRIPPSGLALVISMEFGSEFYAYTRPILLHTSVRDEQIPA